MDLLVCVCVAVITVHMGHEYFLPTAVRIYQEMLTHSSVVSDGAHLYSIMVVNIPSECALHNMADQEMSAEYIRLISQMGLFLSS